MNKYKDVVERIEDSTRDPNEVIYDGNYKIKEFKPCQLEIIITDEITKKLEYLLEQTKKHSKEYGCFLYGNRLDDDTIYLTEKSNEDFISNKDSIDVSLNNLYELRELLFNDLYDVVVHVHTHPELGDEYASDCYSNQDLYTYGYLQKHHQYGTYYTLFIGAMLNNHNGKENISFVYYDEEDKTFYKIPNIYYVKTEKNKEYIKK